MEHDSNRDGQEPDDAEESAGNGELPADSYASTQPAVVDDPLSSQNDLPITEEVVIEARHQALQVAQSVMAWQAPLPMPDDYRAYKEVDPDLAHAIKARYLDQTDLMRSLSTTEQSFTSRELDLAANEQAIRRTESDSDIAIRSRTSWFGIGFATLVVVLAFIVFMWGPGSGSARVAAAGVLMSPVLVLSVVVVLRGRMSPHEQRAISDAVKHVRRGGPPSPDDELPPNPA